eukprot:scaffold30330_cov127-Amphora_coffeaeformis.AAC.1
MMTRIDIHAHVGAHTARERSLMTRTRDNIACPVIETEASMLSKPMSTSIGRDIWIADTGATCHMTNQIEGLYDIKPVKREIRLGDKSTVIATQQGRLKIIVHQTNRKEKEAELKNLLYVPELGYNLFSLSQVVKFGGFTLRGDVEGYHIRKGDFNLSFD